MKNFLLTFIVFYSVSSFAQDTLFTIYGKANNGFETDYCLYEPDVNGQWVKVSCAPLKNEEYLFKLFPGSYLIAFTSREKLKHLYLIVTSSGEYLQNLNFDSVNHAAVFFNDNYGRYMTHIVNDSVIEQLSK